MRRHNVRETMLGKAKEEKGKKLQFSQLEVGKLSRSSELHEGNSGNDRCWRLWGEEILTQE